MKTAVPPGNVFGPPVKGKDRKESAIKAYNNPNAAEKRSMAVNYVKAKKDNWGRTGGGVATLAIFYNATGQELQVVTDTTDSKYGHFLVDPPAVVQNGQWGAFVHVQEDDATTISEGFVAYKGLIKDTSTYSNQLLGWMTTRSINTIHSDIFAANVDPPSTDQIYKDIETNPKSDVRKIGMHVIATFEDGIIYKYRLTRNDVV